MFESDGKKALKGKPSNRLLSVAQGGLFGNKDGSSQNGTGVFKELKLSEILNCELDKVK